MKYAYFGLGMLAFGFLGIVFILMMQSVTIDNESEYYVLKEAMQAAMLESVDMDCYRNASHEGCGGTIKISEQKFVENFTRRFVSTISGDADDYTLNFYDIIESPPKASVVISGLTDSFGITDTDKFTISNSLNGILQVSDDFYGERRGVLVLENGKDVNNKQLYNRDSSVAPTSLSVNPKIESKDQINNSTILIETESVDKNPNAGDNTLSEGEDIVSLLDEMSDEEETTIDDDLTN